MAGPQGLSYPAHLTGTRKASRFSGKQCQELNSCHSKPAVLGWWSWVCAAARWADGTALHRVVPVIQRGSFLPLSQGWINVPPHCWGFKALCWWGKLFSFWQEKRQCWSPSCLLFLNISYFPPPSFLLVQTISLGLQKKALYRYKIHSLWLPFHSYLAILCSWFLIEAESLGKIKICANAHVVVPRYRAAEPDFFHFWGLEFTT